MQAEVGQRNAVDERARSLRDDHLAAVRGAHHPRRAVDVDADVALVGDDRLTRVDPDPHLHRTVAERLLSFSRGRNGVGCASERNEQRVALRVDLDPFVTTEHVAQGAPVIGKQRHVARPVLVQQARRALDVGEEERDRPSRELGHRRVGAHWPPEARACHGIRQAARICGYCGYTRGTFGRGEDRAPAPLGRRAPDRRARRASGGRPRDSPADRGDRAVARRALERAGAARGSSSRPRRRSRQACSSGFGSAASGPRKRRVN